MRLLALCSTAALRHAIQPRGVVAAIRGTPGWDAQMARVGTEMVNERGELCLIDGVVDPTGERLPDGRLPVHRPGEATDG